MATGMPAAWTTTWPPAAATSLTDSSTAPTVTASTFDGAQTVGQDSGTGVDLSMAAHTEFPNSGQLLSTQSQLPALRDMATTSVASVLDLNELD